MPLPNERNAESWIADLSERLERKTHALNRANQAILDLREDVQRLELGILARQTACEREPSGLTGFYVREHAGRYEVRFSFEGETVFDDPEDARQAVEEYRQAVIESDPIREDERELYQRALKAWGHEAQVGMVQEECAEAIVAASKILRNWTKDTADAFCEELADVEIMVGQMRAWLGDAAIGLHKAMKLKRLREKLNRV